jgi:hypothetical protein
MEKKTIPDSVLALLKEPWEPCEDIFSRTLERRPHVAVDPSYYCYYSDDSFSTETGVFQKSEVDKLAQDHMLITKSSTEDCVTVHEQEIHALTDFCSEVWDAWRKLESRMKQVRP